MGAIMITVTDPTSRETTDIRQRQNRSQISSDAKNTECPECGREFTNRIHMLAYYRSKHEGIKYPCN